MKTPRRRQNPLRTPLNNILGTEANVRLLRALALAPTPMAAGELAHRASLGRTSIYPALESLEHTGIVEFVGAGAQRQVRFRAKHALGRALTDLFLAEAHRVDALLMALRAVFQEITLQPTSAWVEGVSSDVDETGETLVLYVLSDPQSLTAITDSITKRLLDIERQFSVQVEVRGLTRSEFVTRAAGNAERYKGMPLLAGVPPTAFVAPIPQKKARERSHQGSDGLYDHDETARRLGVAIAEKLKRDPGLVRSARRFISKRYPRASAREQRELREWDRLLLTMSPARLRRFLTESGERAERLRQTLPALDFLNSQEREAVLAATSDEEVRAVVSGRSPSRR